MKYNKILCSKLIKTKIEKCIKKYTSDNIGKIVITIKVKCILVDV